MSSIMTVLSMAIWTQSELQSSNEVSFLFKKIFSDTVITTISVAVTNLPSNQQVWQLQKENNNIVNNYYLSTCAIVLGPNQLPTGLPSDTPIWAMRRK